jgi:hypothetical protein
VVLCAVAIAGPMTAGVPPARADGDPASDVLLAANVFYPYEPPTSASLMNRLNGATTEAAKLGVPVKVAVIASPIDLGVIPQLLGRPQEYAAYLDQEISFGKRQPLLVVMADGYGTESLSTAAAAALARLPRPTAKTPDTLVSAAISAVARIASAEAHPLSGSAPASATGSRDGSTGTALVVVLVVLVGLTAAGTVVALTLRRRRPASGS